MILSKVVICQSVSGYNSGMKPKMGRPEKPKDEKLTATVIAKLLPAERKKAVARAKSAGLTVSGYIRKLIVDTP
jgi:hypothetical protein